MTNLFNINAVTFRGKVLNDVKTNDINLATDTFESDELVTMKSIESWIKQSSTSKVELIDMIQNACWYIDSSESEFKNTFTELYYNLELEKTTDDSYHQKEKEHYRFLYNMDRIILQHQHLENH